MIACLICGRPESEGGLLNCPYYGPSCEGPCNKFQGPQQRHYRLLTTDLMNELELLADQNISCEVSAHTLHSLLRCARYAAQFWLDAGA